MIYIKALLLLALVGLATARNCTNIIIETPIVSRQGKFREVPLESNVDVGEFATRLAKFQSNYSAELLEGYQTLKKTFNISTQYCEPDGGSSDTIQLLIHGIGFDKTYWDLEYDNYNYSYVNVALDAGYSTLAIDRLGIGNSSHGDPFNEIQAQASLEALNSLTLQLRNGTICAIGRPFKKVIHVGHSFGSVLSYWLSAKYPSNTDGLILTGFSVSSQFLPYIIAGWNLHSARLNQPFRFGNASNTGIRKLATQYSLLSNLASGFQKILRFAGVNLAANDVWNILSTTELSDFITGYNRSEVHSLNYPSGYMTHSSLTALQYAFLQPSNYDINLALHGEATKQAVTAGELLTIGSGPASSSFTGPVLVITGETDVPFCGGNCYGKIPGMQFENMIQAVDLVFPGKKEGVMAYVQPETGHGLNFHYNATGGYGVMQEFLASNGLAA
ncbi:hypothetical protein COCCADRAFT_81899 [Bipolaris zeicola 26-R-13]|uniref:AB hydrolase-1 domain-containing protein n=1 Tax=Cochliobolus carbonum (strain 26-R-13) TaxID=930089 RepID=W6YMT9_COCC2|nr:uncharacterized protein COCCADRAFT_81899 [Bipolaris zeicola 26-R-13]EUC38798.1 hypothetical protein COCCADRAFT_81899 [Bipolaris zeicola 26-R-13]